MAKHAVPVAPAALVCLSLCLWVLLDSAEAVPPPSSVSVSVSDTDGPAMGIGRSAAASARGRRYPLLLTGRRPDSRLRARLQIDPADLLLDEDDALLEMNKRQLSDDYGHMRFGKRAPGEFDDYGHMRFGRSSGGRGSDSTD